MMQRRLCRLLVLLGLLVLPTCATQPAGQNVTVLEINAVGDSIEFPLQVGTFRRGQVLAYASDLTDISIGYNSRAAKYPAASTVYFYPIRRPGATAAVSLEREFEAVKAAMARFPGGRWVERRATVQVEQASGLREGLTATYRYQARLSGEAVEVFTVLHLFLDNGRFVKFRHTYPVVSAALYRRDIDELMMTLKWEGIDDSNVAAALGQPS